MNLSRFFEHWSITENPFRGEEARHDPVFHRLSTPAGRSASAHAPGENSEPAGVPSPTIHTTHSDFDSRRRLRSVQTYRGAAPLWSSTPAGISPAPTANPPEPTLQLLLQDLDYSYDVVGNPTEIRDWRTADEWPAGAKPVTRRMEYDDLYRVTRVDYEYPGGSDTWKSPHAADMPSSNDQRRQKPVGMRTFANRPLWQTYKYDWLGNTTFTDDDQHALLDR